MPNSNGLNDTQKKRMIITSVVTIISMLVIFFIFMNINPRTEDMTYNEFVEQCDAKQIVLVEYQPGLDYFLCYKDSEKRDTYKVPNPRFDDFKKELLERGIEVKEIKIKGEGISWTGLLITIIQYGVLITLFLFVIKKMTGGTDQMQIQTESTKKFSDVAGLAEVKESLLTIVDMLKEPKKYERAGARISKGVLLYGPPGTGKTLLAKAIAGEAGINFIAVNGSDFDNKYVGVGADNVRQLFKAAKEKAPCILFIDEIDSVGGKRSPDGKSYERQTLTQLLSCMDGFSSDDQITVFAATNDVESLDPALLRPGRFDAHYAVGLPDTAEERKQVINLYLKNKMVDESVDPNILAKETLGCSPADIEAIVNEAAILSVKDGGVINKTHIDEAFYKQIMNGHKKKTSDRDLHEIETTAYHEAGHALVGHLLGEDVSKISIIPTTSGAGGVTIFNQKKLGMYSKQELENKVKMLYAGRNAELILNGPSGITTGASNDIKEATKIIISMVSSYGMSSYGLLDLTQIQQEEELLKEYQKISEELNRECSILLKENKDKLDALAHVLIQKETIDENELKEIYSSFDEINPEHILSEGVVLEDNFEDDSSEEYDLDDDTSYDDSNTEDKD